MPIKQLPESVIARIAAGEVITSPYNIVKELIENSLDAHASLIVVEIDSSLRNIRVRDNGDGIEKEDLEFLCKNYFTSKIESVEELKRTGLVASSSSFGFRGEALHSISLCSRLEVRTRTPKDEKGEGHLGMYDNDRLGVLKPCAFEGSGTLIDIKNIFYNNPIRGAHYHKNKTELLNCVELVASYGVIFNAMECRVDGKLMVGRDMRARADLIRPICIDVAQNETRGCLAGSSARDNFTSLNVRAALDDLVDLDQLVSLKEPVSDPESSGGVEYNSSTEIDLSASGGVEIKRSSGYEIDEAIVENRKTYIMRNLINTKNFLGSTDSLRDFYQEFATLNKGAHEAFFIICSDPSVHFRSSSFVFIVNKRLVKNGLLKNKLLQKYRNIKKGSNPFVFVEMFLEDVDVNVHPSKAEVLVNTEAIVPEILQAFDTLFADNIRIDETPSDPDSDMDLGSIPMASITSIEELEPAPLLPSGLLPHRTPQSSPLKIYSSPYLRSLDEPMSQLHPQPFRKFSLISLKILRDEIEEVEEAFFKSAIFTGAYEDKIFIQHQTNLIKIDKEPFLFNVFYQKVLREFGNFECVELACSIETGISEDLWDLLKEYFGIHIEDGRIIGTPKMFDISLEDENNHIEIAETLGAMNITKEDELETLRTIAEEIARVYSKVDVDAKLFNQMKTEIVATVKIAETLSLMSDLRDLYKTFDRC